jgi:hypothetical protein
VKKTTLLIAAMSLVMACATAGQSQGRAQARVKPPTGGNQICTGCCDPCYSDDWWKVRQPQTNMNNAKTTKTRKGKR